MESCFLGASPETLVANRGRVAGHLHVANALAPEPAYIMRKTLARHRPRVGGISPLGRTRGEMVRTEGGG